LQSFLFLQILLHNTFLVKAFFQGLG
jgi:hypothetical protein